MDNDQMTVTGAPAEDDPFEAAIDEFNRELTDAIQRGTTRPAPAAYLARVGADRRRDLLHALCCSWLYLVIREGGERLRVEEVAKAYGPPATADELLALIRVEADARVLAERRENPDSIRADLRVRFHSFAAELSGTFLDDLQATQRDASPPDPPGYSFLRRIGGGGQASVWLARDNRSRLGVAIKAIHTPKPAESSTDTLRREAERLQGMHHANIVRVHGYIEHAGYALLVMDYIAGGTLGTRYGASRWPLIEALDTVATLAGAVQFAHEGGVLHLDLKPDNVMIAQNGAGHDVSAPRVVEGIPRIVDWGMYRVRGDEGRSSPYGTPAYMAPEQARGEDPDCRTDVWGLGAILYYLLLHRPLYSGPDTRAVLERARDRHDYVRPREDDRSIPPDVEACLLKALSPDRAARQPTVAVLEKELRELAARHRERPAPEPTPVPVPPPVAPRAPRGWAPKAMIAVLAVGLIAGSVFLFGTKPDAGTAKGTDAPNGTGADKSDDPGTHEGKDDGSGKTDGGPKVTPGAEPPFEINLRGIAYSAKNPKNKLRLTDGIELFSRDQFRLHVRSERECHLYVVNVDTRGDVALLCPHPKVAASSRIAAKSQVRLPGADGPAQNNWYTLDEHAGIDSIYLVASLRPVAALEGAAGGRLNDDVLRRLPTVLTDMLSQHRGVEVKAANPAIVERDDDPEVGWERVRPRGTEPAPDLIVKGWQINHRARP